MTHTIWTWVIAIVMAALFVMMMWLAGRRARPAPRQVNSIPAFAKVSLALVALFMILFTFESGDWIMGCFTVFLIVVALHSSSRSSESENISNWVYDPGKCGRCAYDLSYQDDPARCPECGWQVPPAGVRAERSDWHWWWRGWRIGYLNRPRMMFVLMLSLTLPTLAAVAWIAYHGAVPIAALMLICSVHSGVNAARVWMYMQRERAQEREHEKGLYQG